jgi:citrate lyase subunit beta / citryl-CoA lyase
MPVHLRRFVEKANSRGADAICLDLEDSVPADQKNLARSTMRDAVEIVRDGSSDVLVRINKSSASQDLTASCWNGVQGIVFPKAETPQEIVSLDKIITNLEKDRGLRENSIEINILIESAKGVLSMQSILSASQRMRTVSIGHEDLCLDLGIIPTEEGRELFYAKSKLVMQARAAGLIPTGLMGTLSNFSDLNGLRLNAQSARNLGFKGAGCIHPAQVPVLNEVFSPTREEVEYSIKVIEKFKEANSIGQASIQLDGKMIDTPVYERAKAIVEFAKEIQKREQRKGG